ACADLLRQQPIQAESREHLREPLKVASGGVVFTTIQKFFPDTDRGSATRRDTARENANEPSDAADEAKSCGSQSRAPKAGKHPLRSDRRNIVVIADEAHRSQYDFIDGFARHMRDALPRASFIGFTGTPIERG